MTRTFRQVDVFSPGPLPGNPVAVVHDADSMSDDEMLSFANWTNLSETTFLLAPRSTDADYRLRIFTPARELPFAGHPTLGSAHAWLEAGGRPRHPGIIVQECEAGLVRVRSAENRLAFMAPPLTRYENVEPRIMGRLSECLRIDPSDIRDAQWIDNGPGWVGVLLPSAQFVLDLNPDLSLVKASGLKIGVAGFFSENPAPADLEVRAFGAGDGSSEDPVTGSLNAGLARWFTDTHRVGHSYSARQGTTLGRGGFIHVTRDDEVIWVSGATRTVISGNLDW
ncbi:MULTISPECIES: PhzF family phenazine biosynthesis protein [Kocuria]|uniref:PhzF family phenazine biosynthesis protein n=1 Tax=Kocuria TaxID=57493 RepID=UPI0006607D1C|nr:MULTISPECIES: PhzF family phenazine biosynthesis protein [Kocuria]